MPDLGFKDHHAPGLLSGEKPFTLRRAWKNGKTPDVGTTVGIVTGWRTPARRKIATARVMFRCALTFSEGGIEAFYQWRQDPIAAGSVWKVKGFLLEAQVAGFREYPIRRKAASDFARLDGFEDYAAFWRFHSNHRAEGADPIIKRELIGFGLVTPEFAQ